MQRMFLASLTIALFPKIAVVMARPRRKTMPKSYGERQMLLARWLLASLAGMATAQQAVAESATPVFSPTAQTAYVGIGIGAFLPVPWHVF